MCLELSQMKKFRLTGGIGNQLFIYAAGLYYESKTGEKVKFDLTDRYRENSIHASDIRKLNLSGTFENNFLGILKAKNQRKKVDYSIRSKFDSHIYVSAPVGFDPNLENSLPFKQFRGYFQSYIYSEYEPVRLELKKSTLLNTGKYFRDFQSLIGNESNIAIHIRRGDYAQNMSTHGLLSSEYFGNSIELIRDSNSKIKFKNLLVFSDSMVDAVKIIDNLNLKLDVIKVDRQKLTDEESLILLSRSKNLVISNSTFSWWAARLGVDKDIVVAPRKWFINLDDPEFLIPPYWSLMDSKWID